jgi:2-amino-4-hydroxy-6-hydroxymethyldihydropteridine diphosphokinase
MIFIGIGANLPSSHGDPRATCERAVEALAAAGLKIVARSRWYESAPVPMSDQPWYVNGVVAVETAAKPSELLALLHKVEAAFGRQRRKRNEARVLDLDLLAYHDEVSPRGDDALVLPHPRLQERAFVLLPLAELAPDWRYPASGEPIAALIAKLDPGQQTRALGAAENRR